MGLKITSLDGLTNDQVQQAHAEIAQLLQDSYPEVELSMGVVYSLICYFNGVFGAREQAEVKRHLDSRSLLAISTDPELADSELTDHVLSNHRIVRKAGVEATGRIAVVVDADITTVVPAGVMYVANGLNFVVAFAFIARATNTTPAGNMEVALTPLGDGRYSFTIPATCEIAGPEGNLRRGTRMVPDSPPSGFVTAYAATDFAGGTNDETNAELIARMQEGVAAKAWSNRTNIVALIHEQDNFADTLAYSIIGYQYPEMTRDQHGIIPLSGGGRTDLYSRTAPTPMHTTLTKTATLVDITADGGVWQFSLAKSDMPGFYEVVKILKLDDDPEYGGFVPSLDLRGFDLTGDGALPDVTETVEAAYTSYQTAVIRFVDGETSTADLTVGTTTADYAVVVSAMPLIAELQTFCMDDSTSDPAGDCLVKAAVPCFLTVNFEIQQATGETAPDTDEIATELAAAVNVLGFPGQLHSSYLADVVHRYLTVRQGVKKFDMFGRIRRPDGTMAYIRDDNVIQIPDDPGNMVTGRTTVFILDPNDVNITVLTEGFTTRP